QSGKAHGEQDLKIETTGASRQLIQDTVTAIRANGRQGNASTKTRGEVAGAGKKLWRQKGTGRARMGSIRSPVWRHGGIVFGPKPRSYAKKVSKRQKRTAFREVFLARANAGDLIIVRDLKFDSPKTKAFAALIGKLPLEGKKSLLVYGQPDKNLILAGRNLADLDLTSADSLNVYQLMRYGKVVLTGDAVDIVRARVEGKSHE
ncbi:MAG: 50S ribosomal protein L4, partial [Verrucomicrobiae bacterium]|nr:50S ribosomal protein L4 [Verrucomicrobiae bacterium]